MSTRRTASTPNTADYDEARIDRRWMWIAGIAGAILFVAIGTTGIILGGGDSGSVSATATSGAPTTSAAPVTSGAAAAATRARGPRAAARDGHDGEPDRRDDARTGQRLPRRPRLPPRRAPSPTA